MANNPDYYESEEEELDQDESEEEMENVTDGNMENNEFEQEDEPDGEMS